MISGIKARAEIERRPCLGELTVQVYREDPYLKECLECDSYDKGCYTEAKDPERILKELSEAKERDLAKKSSVLNIPALPRIERYRIKEKRLRDSEPENEEAQKPRTVRFTDLGHKLVGKIHEHGHPRVDEDDVMEDFLDEDQKNTHLVEYMSVEDVADETGDSGVIFAYRRR